MKIAICDDEKIMREQVKMYINMLHKPVTIDEYSDGHELVRSRTKYDIIFMDIEMPDISGMETAEKLRNNNVDAHIIFLTSHMEYVLEAFKVKAFRFLTKPIDKDTFFAAFSEAENEIANVEKISINFKGRFYDIKVRDIVYIEASGDGTYIYDKFGNVYECSVQLKEWDEKLGEKYFFKIHKSYIISLFYVTSFEDKEVKLLNVKGALTVSRRNITKFKDIYMNFIKNNAHVI